jgi:hypothetical protein
VYVATEGNTVYAIDAHSGTVLLKPNFGTPVRYPLGCGNNGPNVGINSTPVIDTGSNTLYVMVYTQGSAPTYTLHALDLGSLTDKVAAQTVVASHTLTNGTTFNFNAKYQRQRPGLLLANGSIYAGFGSFCAGLDGGHAGAVSLEPVERPATDRSRHIFSVVDLDVGIRAGGRRCGQHCVRDRQLRREQL